MVHLHAAVHENLFGLLPHTLPLISSECVAFECSGVFPHGMFASLCLVRGCYMFGDTSRRAACENDACGDVYHAQMYVISDFIGVQLCALTQKSTFPRLNSIGGIQPAFRGRQAERRRAHLASGSANKY